MKPIFLFLMGLLYSTCMYAQNIQGSVVVVHKSSIIKIKFSNDSLSATCNDKLLPATTTAELDSCLKTTIQDFDHPITTVESPTNIDNEKIRTLLTVLTRHHCTVMVMMTPLILSTGSAPPHQ